MTTTSMNTEKMTSGGPAAVVRDPTDGIWNMKEMATETISSGKYNFLKFTMEISNEK